MEEGKFCSTDGYSRVPRVDLIFCRVSQQEIVFVCRGYHQLPSIQNQLLLLLYMYNMQTQEPCSSLGSPSATPQNHLSQHFLRPLCFHTPFLSHPHHLPDKPPQLAHVVLLADLCHQLWVLADRSLGQRHVLFS